MPEITIVYRHVETDCRKCKRGIHDGMGHTFCTAIRAWGVDSEQNGTCKFFSEKKHNRKRVSK